MQYIPEFNTLKLTTLTRMSWTLPTIILVPERSSFAWHWCSSNMFLWHFLYFRRWCSLESPLEENYPPPISAINCIPSNFIPIYLCFTNVVVFWLSDPRNNMAGDLYTPEMYQREMLWKTTPRCLLSKT